MKGILVFGGKFLTINKCKVDPRILCKISQVLLNIIVSDAAEREAKTKNA